MPKGCTTNNTSHMLFEKRQLDHYAVHTNENHFQVVWKALEKTLNQSRS